MPDLVDGLAIRKRLGRKQWSLPRPLGPDGFSYIAHNGDGRPVGIVIVTGWYEDDDRDERGAPIPWIHASMQRPDGVPSYEDLTLLHAAVWPDGHAYQCFVPPDDHINAHERVLHLWGRADGTRLLPDFGKYGTI
ncbi:DUF7694 domain-containing protein [Prauserella muralis]|uniref:DUF7694 domain-containing protein n=1 Tax=Prauserella muralis TaxID=588067 RepID=A0A2V4AYZ9_9PSEU|nr:hypothetical protein [Prauserella muralis]PXY21150.1 hypothetical protein BAY60_27165 [Prauserella muralis]TWE30238.1 hypothetical protein FHX69_2935 [Prauserella muralis]